MMSICVYSVHGNLSTIMFIYVYSVHGNFGVPSCTLFRGTAILGCANITKHDEPFGVPMHNGSSAFLRRAAIIVDVGHWRGY